MESITSIISSLNSIVWGKPMLILILGVGLYLLLGLRFMPWKKLGYALLLPKRSIKNLSNKIKAGPNRPCLFISVSLLNLCKIPTH